MNDVITEIGRVFLKHFRKRRSKNLCLRCGLICKLLNKSLFSRIKIYMVPSKNIVWNDARISGFTDLKVLHDNGNITDISMLTDLQVLIMHHNSGIINIGKNKNIRVLELSKHFDNIDQIYALKNLKELYCYYNENIQIVDGLNLETLQTNNDIQIHQPNIKRLKLGMRVNPNNIMFMNRLESFESESALITDMHLSLLSSSLKRLSINRGKISDAGLRHLDLYRFEYYGDELSYNGIQHMHLHKLIMNAVDDKFNIPPVRIPQFNLILVKYNDNNNRDSIMDFRNYNEGCSDNGYIGNVEIYPKKIVGKIMNHVEIKLKLVQNIDYNY